jgi:hypothetical protein
MAFWVAVGPGFAWAGVFVVNPGHPGAGDENPGSAQRPLQTIGRAAELARAGDTVVIHGGVYREAVNVTQSGTAERPIRFVGADGATVVVTGTDRLTQWTKESADENVFSTPWPHRFITWSKQMTHPGDARHLLIGRAEQVFALGYPLRQVLARENLTRGTFWVDAENKRLWVRSADDRDLSKGSVRVEASVRPVVWDCRGDYVQVKGIRFRYAANRAQEGAAQFRGRGDLVEDCVFERTNSIGATFAAEGIGVRRCTFADNGQMGFGAARAHGLVITGCTVRGNNVKNFDRGWEAGGDKLVLCRGAVIERSTFVENRGTGIWFDIGNEDCTVRNCLIADNEDGGIFYEISRGLKAHDNVIVGNGLAESPGAWAMWAGVCLSSSPGCLIERNLIVGNKEGLAFREQFRTTASIDDKAERAIWNHDSVVRNNVIAYNRDAQVAGWFDQNDERHWPARMQETGSKGGGGGAAGEDLAKAYQARDARGQPSGLSLEALKLIVDQNVYAVHPGQGLWRWGPTWKRHKQFSSLEEVAAELGFERGGLLAGSAPFADFAALDLRLPEGHEALARKCYPSGDVPGVVLGSRSK